MVSGWRTAGCFRVSSLNANTWSSVRSTVSWSTSTFFSTGSSSPSPVVVTLAAPNAANSALARSLAASWCSLIRRSEMSTKSLALSMCGTMELQMPAKRLMSTLPSRSGSARHNKTWMCKRLRQISSARRSASRSFQIFVLPNSSKPISRKRVTKCTRNAFWLQATTALRSASVRKCSQRSAKSSTMTKPFSSSGNICINIAAS
mmetsp:Transcript_109809/g.317487  ORF Transcript_109809/g.317487 Transcript_109809/m.317487 type:complete len:204 (-) Transcript_109809:1171-1782(-)